MTFTIYIFVLSSFLFKLAYNTFLKYVLIGKKKFLHKNLLSVYWLKVKSQTVQNLMSFFLSLQQKKREKKNRHFFWGGKLENIDPLPLWADQDCMANRIYQCLLEYMFILPGFPRPKMPCFVNTKVI